MSTQAHESWEIGTEYAVLSSLLSYNDLISAVEVEAEHFPTAASRKLFEVLCALIAEMKNVDMPMFVTHLHAKHPETGWDAELDKIAATLPSRGMFTAHQEAVRGAYDAKRARAIGSDLQRTGDASAALEKLRTIAIPDSRHAYDGAGLVSKAVNALDHPPRATKTGIAKIDNKTGGLHEEDLVVIGARPGMGKTALAINMALSSEKPFLFFSGEQGAEQWSQRALAVLGEVPLWRMRMRQLTEDDWRSITQAGVMLKNSSAHVIDRSSPSLQDVVTQSRRYKHEHNIRTVYVDYLQRMRMTGQSRREAVEATIRGLKELARELSVTVVVLAQVNREVDNRKDQHPLMGDLLESGAIESEADVILMLSRPVVYDPEADERRAILSIGKNRHGVTGGFPLAFVADVLRFETWVEND